MFPTEYLTAYQEYATMYDAANHRLQRSGGGDRYGDGLVVRRRPLNRAVRRLTV